MAAVSAIAYILALSAAASALLYVSFCTSALTAIVGSVIQNNITNKNIFNSVLRNS